MVKRYDIMLSRFHPIQERYGWTECFTNIARQCADCRRII